MDFCNIVSESMYSSGIVGKQFTWHWPQGYDVVKNGAYETRGILRWFGYAQYKIVVKNICAKQ